VSELSSVAENAIVDGPVALAGAAISSVGARPIVIVRVIGVAAA